MNARYAFRVQFRLEPEATDVTVERPTFETRVTVTAPEPGREGWRFFRDVCWRGEVNDQRYARELFERKLGVPVESVSFSALEADEAYVEALKAEIAANLEQFNAENVSEVLSKYLGSSINVRPDEDA